MGGPWSISTSYHNGVTTSATLSSVINVGQAADAAIPAIVLAVGGTSLAREHDWL